MDNKDDIFISNKEKLKENHLNFVFESEIEGEFDLRIETLSGKLLVTDLQYHIDPAQWLDDNIDAALNLLKNLKRPQSCG